MGIKIQAHLGEEGFMELDVDELTQHIQRFGHRFARQRAERIALVREKWKDIKELIRNNPSGKEIRQMIADSKSPYKIKGFGYKEASHFLRNIGFHDVAIVDRHIYRFLLENSLIEEVKTLTPRLYLRAEKALSKLCKDLGLKQSELDLYIFYAKTRKVLK
jgi:N-glycosylase/DNA lyase